MDIGLRQIGLTASDPTIPLYMLLGKTTDWYVLHAEACRRPYRDPSEK